MKKLLAIALGIGIALGTVSFAQDTSKSGDSQKMQSKKKKKKADKTDTTPTTKKN